jgi:hypothetical protein
LFFPNYFLVLWMPYITNSVEDPDPLTDLEYSPPEPEQSLEILHNRKNFLSIILR